MLPIVLTAELASDIKWRLGNGAAVRQHGGTATRRHGNCAAAIASCAALNGPPDRALRQLRGSDRLTHPLFRDGKGRAEFLSEETDLQLLQLPLDPLQPLMANRLMLACR